MTARHAACADEAGCVAPRSDSDPTPQITYRYYEGLTTRELDALNKQSVKVANVTGAVVRSGDHDGFYQSFDYDAFGHLLRVTDSLGATLQANTFNGRGLRTAQLDQAAGSWNYGYNALGERLWQRDAKSQTTTFGYDGLGRLTTRSDAEGTHTFTFGASAAAKNIGRLAAMAGPGYAESYSYDALGRPQTTTINSDASYTIDYSYNSIGALDTLTYPASTSGYRLKLQYDYQNGQLLRVKNANAPGTFWSANDSDARGALINETLGNGIQTIRGYDAVTGSLDYLQSGPGGALQNLTYAWDALGNLTQRQDVRQGLTENFYYDNLHRLITVSGPDPQTLSYDARGNLTDRSGNVRPGDSHTLSWRSDHLPASITGPTGYSSQFFYTPEGARFKQQANYGGASETTIYVGGLIEKVTLGADHCACVVCLACEAMKRAR